MDNNKMESGALNSFPLKLPNKMDVLMSPHKIIIIFLVLEHSRMKDEQRLSAKFRRRFFMLLLKLIRCPDMNFTDLNNMLKSVCDDKHKISFDNIIASMDNVGIDVFFVDKAMSQSYNVCHYGVVGLYLRRVVFSLDCMSFSELQRLFRDLKIYFNKGNQEDEQKLSSEAPKQFTTYLRDSQPKQLKVPRSQQTMNKNDFDKWSLKQADLFVSQQCNLLEINEASALNPIEMQNHLKDIIKDNPLYSQAHILSYMNNIRIRDFFNSLDSFHRAFDRGNIKGYNSQSQTNFLQYSSLNLAILHAQFNHNKEALACLRECVMLAQECGDGVCLQLAKSWLYALDKNQVQLNENTIANLTAKELDHSVSKGIQFVVIAAATTGFLPSKLFKLLMKSEVLNAQRSFSHLMANCIAEKASLWALFGKNELASLNSQLLLHSVHTHSKKGNDNMQNGESVCQSLCCVALWLCLQGDYILSMVVLRHARERFPRDPLARYWLLTYNYIITIQSINRSKWEDSIKACSQLYTLDRPISILQRAATNIARRNNIYAKKLLNSLLQEFNLQPLNRVRAMILLANTLMDENNIYADAINILNDASVLAKQKFLSYEVAIIDVNFAYILLKMDMPQQAVKTITSSMETILSNGSLYDNAKTLFLFVRSLIAAQTTRIEKIEKLLETIEILNNAAEQFTKIEAYAKAKDVYIYLADFFNDVEMLNERNLYATKFRQIEEQYPTPIEYLNVFF